MPTHLIHVEPWWQAARGGPARRGRARRAARARRRTGTVSLLTARGVVNRRKCRLTAHSLSEFKKQEKKYSMKADACPQ